MIKRIFLCLPFFLITTVILSWQPIKYSRTGNETRNKQKSQFRDLNHSQADTLFYIDSVFNFQVRIPKWLTLKETNSRSLWGGVLPEIDGIENAILIKSFYKSEFSSFEAFKEIYLTGNKFGKPAKFSKEHLWYGQHPPIEIDKGVRQKVFLAWKNKIYYNEFVLIETKSAYLWIQFTSTQGTYDQNISKFNEFMDSFKTTSF
jgi:hypothetical protein